MLRPLLLTACIAALATGAPATAQTVTGSGVVPATVDHSAERPIRFADAVPATGAVAVLLDGATAPATLDPGLRTAVERGVAASKFTGKANATTWAMTAEGRPVLLVGTGPTPTPFALQEAAGKAAQALKDHAGPVAIVAPGGGTALAETALGYGLGQYRFDRYKSDRKPRPADAVTFVGTDAAAAQAAWNDRWRWSAAGVKLTRDLSNEPAGVIYPASFIERVRAAVRDLPNVSVEVLDEAAMRALNMGAIVGVGQGSPRGSRLLVVTYKGAGGAPLAFVGKGITFDSGGISLKPGAGMWAMKGDMAGAAATMGALISLAGSRAPVHVVAVAALAENMPDGNAQRPGDVVRTMSGKTIEVINTDAEGRLVLADAIEWTIARKKPAALIDVATLTGAVSGALGDEYAGLFARDERLATALMTAGTQTGELLWRLPLHPNIVEEVKSDIADVRNSVEGAAGAGASIGAAFIGFFVDPATPWAHLDIASVDLVKSDQPTAPKGSAGFGVRVLDRMARDWRP